jgi:hypothetical protein
VQELDEYRKRFEQEHLHLRVSGQHAITKTDKLAVRQVVG